MPTERRQLGGTPDKALELLKDRGITRSMAKQAPELAATQGRFTVFTVVDAPTRVAGRLKYAGDRVEADEKAGKLLELVA